MSEGGAQGPELPEYSERTPLLTGIALWVVLLVLSLVFHSRLDDHGHGWWVGVAVAGLVEGLFGFWFITRRQARLQAAPTDRPD